MSMSKYNMIHSLTLLTLHENIDLDNCGDSQDSQDEETHQVNLAVQDIVGEVTIPPRP